MISSFDKPISKNLSPPSYPDSDGMHKNMETWQNLYCFLGVRDHYNGFGCVHGYEYPGDGLDRVQDPQGVLGS